MKLSELIEEFIEMKIQGEPQGSEWRSLRDNAEQRVHWNNYLQELRDKIDAAHGAKE
jgi:hypothetical protein